MRPLDPEAREMLDILLASARSQLDLVNGLLDITRIESGNTRLDRSPFNPASVLEDTVRMVAPEIAAKGLSLDMEIAPSARRPRLGDALAFRQIVTNIVNNALKFTDRGGITVRLETGDEGKLRFIVADTGTGIDPAQHARIFERFVQVDGAATRLVGGAGLGLAITHGLVEMEGGTISVASVLGEGATFTVELPLPPAAPSASAA
jgi:signal transduction histidine kinase